MVQMMIHVDLVTIDDDRWQSIHSQKMFQFNAFKHFDINSRMPFDGIKISINHFSPKGLIHITHSDTRVAARFASTNKKCHYHLVSVHSFRITWNHYFMESIHNLSRKMTNNNKNIIDPRNRHSPKFFVCTLQIPL